MVEVEEEEGEPVGREDGAGTTPMAVRRVMKSRRNAGGGAMVGGEEVGEKERMRMEGVGEVVAGMFHSAVAIVMAMAIKLPALLFKSWTIISLY